MLQRAITGTVFVVVVVGCIWFSQFSMGALMLAIVVFGLLEFYGLAAKANATPQKITGVLLGSALFVFNFLFANNFDFDVRWIFLALPLGALLFIGELYRKKEHPFNNIAWTFLGILWIAVPFSLLNYLVQYDGDHYVPHILLGYFFLLWTSDTCAYLSGKALGKHKLFERISPGKTWEGSIGGTILTIGIAWVISQFFDQRPMLDWMVLAGLIAIFGTLGDLTESMFKRSIGVKDSGNILPGHGGILDRFDGVLISAPIVFAYLMIVG